MNASSSPLLLTFVHCTHNDAAAVQAAKAERRRLINSAQSEDDYLDAAEAHWSEFIPLCFCSRCVAEEAML